MQPFKEKQRFTQWWIWLILVLAPVFTGIAYGLNPNAASGVSSDILGVFFLFLVLALAFLGIHLETHIDPSGISARLFPIHLRFKHYKWTDLESIQVRKYKPISEFGGWGYRSWGGKKGNAWNMSGNEGIQLKFKSGRELLIGTQKPAEVQAYFEALMQTFPNLNVPFVVGNG